MRLVFAIKTLHHGRGGAERVLATVGGALAERGHEVALVTFDAPGVSSFYPLHPGIRHTGLGIGDTSRRSGPVETLRRAIGLRRVLAEARPEVAVGFMHSACVPLAMAALRRGTPLVFSEHIVPRHYRGRPLEYLAFIAAGLRAARITVLSETIRGLYPRAMRRRMVAIPNPVSPLTPDRADPKGRPGRRRVLLAVGRLEAQKDHETLIRAFAALAPRHPDWDLRIVGEGALRPRLEAVARSLGIAGRVALAGVAEDVPAEYLGAQAFCVPSRYESFGLATAEAMSAGLPAVGFADCPGTNELIGDGVNGVLAGSGDRVDALARALEPLLADTALRARLGAAGPDAVRAYAPEAIVDRWEALLREVAASTPGGGA